MNKANFLVGLSITLLVLIGSIFYAEAMPEAKEKTGQTRDNHTDVFGITKIYPTKNGGNTWFMNMANPASDPRFDPQFNITQNPDGSWKMQQSQVRMLVYGSDQTTYETTSIPTFSRTQLTNNGYMQLSSDWRNFEITGYVKLNSITQGGLDQQFTWYGRGGAHNSLNNGCEGSSTKGALHFNGQTQIEKESWHVKYDFSDKITSNPPLLDRWIGFKFIVYNQPGINFAQQVHQEIWLDEFNNNNWLLVHSFIDDGFGSGATHCGPAFADNMPISWGGPIVTFRSDDADDFDFKNFSVREIQNNTVPPNDIDIDGIPNDLDDENIINSSIILTSPHFLSGDVTVQDGAVLTIPSGETLTVTSGKNLTVKTGSGVLIKSGGTLQVNSSSGPIIHMSDTTFGTAQSVHLGRQIHAEYVSPSSQLVGDNIDTIIIKIKKGGLPTGTAQIGVFDVNLEVKKLFGTIDVSTLTTSSTDHSFSLPLGQKYEIQPEDRIGIKFTGGDAANFVAITRDIDPQDPFDGINSYHTYYTTTWVPFIDRDLYMILQENP